MHEGIWYPTWRGSGDVTIGSGWQKIFTAHGRFPLRRTLQMGHPWASRPLRPDVADGILPG